MRAGSHGSRWRTPIATCLVILGAPSSARSDEALRSQAEAAAEIRTVLFGSLDAGRSGFLTFGVKRSLGPSLDRSGPVMMVVAGAGGAPQAEKESRLLSIRGTSQVNGLIGHQWALERTMVAAFLGFEAEREAPRGEVDGFRSRTGLRAQAELWSHPTERSLATATIILGSARPHVWSRITAGYDLLETGVFLGPEATYYASDGYDEWRLGLHATGLRWRRFHLRLSGGYWQASDDRRGAYVAFGVHTRL